MSRSWLRGEDQKWRMFCDVCYAHDDQTFPSPPALAPFAKAGWWIGARIDACPKCVTAGRLPNDVQNWRVHAAADEL